VPCGVAVGGVCVGGGGGGALDAFDPKFYQKKPEFLRRIDNGHRNRLATAFWYMTDVEDGGETIVRRCTRKRDRQTGRERERERGRLRLPRT
jgi:hypothetical protein